MGVSELTRNAVDVLPKGALEEKLELGRPLRVKLGIDVTSPDIHVGRAIPLQRMRAFQDEGHTGVLIIGDYTTRIGDPSGRSAERPVLTDEEIDSNARTYLDQAMVILDPELTIDLPPKLTAATGADALTHCIESFTCPVFHPLCDGIALEGARIAAAALPTAVRNGHDLDARSAMLMSSMMGAIAFQKDLGAVHSCAHALSTVADGGLTRRSRPVGCGLAMSRSISASSWSMGRDL